jgi:hypothetical protein
MTGKFFGFLKEIYKNVLDFIYSRLNLVCSTLIYSITAQEGQWNFQQVDFIPPKPKKITTLSFCLNGKAIQTN